MNELKKIIFFKTCARKAGKIGALLVGMLSVLILNGGCSEDLSVKFQLINPCQEDVFADEGCQVVQVIVSSLVSSDSLHCSKPYPNGPVSNDCLIGQGQCGLPNSSRLLGPGRKVDVLCYVDRQNKPVARATSQPMYIDDGPGGTGSTTLNLLLGNIDGFVETTHLGGSDFTKCSAILQQGGRYGHATEVLEDGRVLITGGIQPLSGAKEILNTVEIYDPVTGGHYTLRDASGSPVRMWAARAYHTATRLKDGRVLIAGGVGLINNKWASLWSSEIFDPATGQFPETSQSLMAAPRAHHTATLLGSGKVLLAGGLTYDGEGMITSVYSTGEIYSRDSNSFTLINNEMSVARVFHGAVKLGEGSGGGVLIVGGENRDGVPYNSIDIYNANEVVFRTDSALANVVMGVPRTHLCAVGLDSNGDGDTDEVLIAGGKTSDGSVNNGIDVFSPGLGPVGGFKNVNNATLDVARMDHSCTLLKTGNVLVAGGKTGGGTATGVGEKILIGSTYDSQSLPDSMNPPRFSHTATVLKNGWVYFAGGLPNDSVGTAAVTQSLLFVPQLEPCSVSD